MTKATLPVSRALFIGLSLSLGLSACADDAATCAAYADQALCRQQLQANRNDAALAFLAGGIMSTASAYQGALAQPTYVAPVQYNAAPVQCWQSGQSFQCH
jgi:hypothetical protein